MIHTSRGLPTIESVCEKHGAKSGFRLRCEYLPGPAPFPESPEEKQWLAARETLVLTVIRLGTGGLVLADWKVGGEDRSERREIALGELDAWTGGFEAAGGWSVATLAPLPMGEGHAELEQDAYEYHDEDPDSLDLDAWSAPRLTRATKGRPGDEAGPTRALLGHWAAFVPARLLASSPLGAAFAR